MANIMLAVFGIFLLVLIVLDVLMIYSLFRTGDERRQLVVWKASAFTLLVVSLTLVFDVIQSLVESGAMLVSPFTKLSVTAMVYFLSLLYYRKRYGD